MDVEKLKKLNQLTKELQKHSFAFTSEDAFKQAEKVFDNVKNNLNTVEQTPPTEQTVIKESTNNNNSVSTENSTDYLLQKKIEYLMEMSTKKFIQEIENMKTEIQNLNLQIQNMKNDQASQQLSQVQPTKTEETVEQPINDEPKQSQTTSDSKKTNEPHPRQGNYKSEDVSIEKMFYFGNK